MTDSLSQSVSFRQSYFLKMALLLGFTLGLTVLCNECCDAADQKIAEDFEGSKPSWAFLFGDARYQLLSQQRVSHKPHQGRQCEKVQFTTTGGTHLFYGQAISKGYVIPELIPSIWVRSNRVGARLIVRVILPHSLNSKTKLPITTYIESNAYSKAEQWQQLSIPNIKKKLTSKIAALRLQHGSAVTAREAHVDYLFLNVYSGVGKTTFWIDDFKIKGHVAYKNSSTNHQSKSTTANQQALKTKSKASEEKNQVQLQSDVLLVNNRPFFPRILQYQNESLQTVKNLGFNTIWLPRPPSDKMLDEVARLKIFVVCPPPIKVERIKTDRRYDQVLTWDLGNQLTQSEYKKSSNFAKSIRANDPLKTRPIVCQPTSNLREYSRIADILIASRFPIGTSVDFASYSTWLQQQTLFSRPGTPFWANIQTQAPLSTQIQRKLLAHSVNPSSAIEPQQTRLLAYLALSRGMRGIYYQSTSSLDATDQQTRLRALNLKLLNMELSLIEPWISTGHNIATVRDQTGTVSATLLQLRRGRLLLPIYFTKECHFSAKPFSGKKLTIITPGVPETNNVYLISAAGLKPLPHQRVTGGIRFELEGFTNTGIVIMTDDIALTSRLKKLSKLLAKQAVQLQIQIARESISLHNRNSQSSQFVLKHHKEAKSWYRQSAIQLQQAVQLASQRRTNAAFIAAKQAQASMMNINYLKWKNAASTVKNPLDSPLATSSHTLTQQRRFMQELQSSRLGSNLLQGGDCESLHLMTTSGWKHFVHHQHGIASDVELSPRRAAQGQMSIHLSVKNTNLQNPVTLIQSSPVWITTPPVLVSSGTLLRISGKVRIPKKIKGSVDGLMILDSFGGETLAHRATKASDWQSFSMYRVAQRNEIFTLTFALTGLGEAFIDDLHIQKVIGVDFTEVKGKPSITRTPKNNRTAVGTNRSLNWYESGNRPRR